MLKKMLLRMPIVSCMCFLFLLAACSVNGTVTTASTPTNIPTKTPVIITAIATSIPTSTAATITATSTISQAGFAATIGSAGEHVNGDDRGDNLTTIHAAGDRPVANFTQAVMNVPPRAKGVVYIQNDSSSNQTLVSDTPDGFATFTIMHNTTTSLVFHRIGTFKAHLKDYPISADTTITIIITMPYPD